MLPIIEKLLLLQDRDRQIARIQAELHNIGPERTGLHSKAEAAQKQLDSARARAMQLESDRKKLELEVEAKKQQIQKYGMQQFQTKKNDEYRALAKEIDLCNAQIRELDDQQLVLMEQGDIAQKESAAGAQAFKNIKADVETELAELARREQQLSEELAALQITYPQLSEGLDETALRRYERLRRNKGANALVGIEHSVCGGCHMKLPVQIVITCQGQKDLVACPNCGRLLYYHEDMDLAVAD